MGVDLHVRSELLADRVFQPACDVVRGTKRKQTVDFEIEGDGEPALDLMHGDVVHRQRAIARGHHDPFEHGLVVERARLRGDRHLGGRPFEAHGFDDTVLERRHAIERQRATDRNDEVDEQHFTDLAHAQPFDLDHAGNAGHSCGDLSATPGGAVSVSVSMVRRASRQPAMQMTTDTTIAATELARA